MLVSDNILEIAYLSDYFTTVNLLKVCPKLNTDSFWDKKWTRMYPNKKSLQFLTNQDVFLIQERKNFVLVLNHNPCFSCGGISMYKNILYEDDNLKNDFVKYSNVKNLVFIPVNLEAQFIVIGTNYEKYIVLNQFDYFDQAEDFCSNKIDSDFIIGDCFIIDMNNIVICFSGLNMERMPNDEKCLYTY